MPYATNPVDLNSYAVTGGNQLPADVSSTILANAVEESVVLRLARRVEIPSKGAILPIVNGEPEAEWAVASDNGEYYETAEKAVSVAELGHAQIVPVTLAVIEPFSNQFRDNWSALYDELVRRLPYALGRKLDRTVFGYDAAPAVIGNIKNSKVVTIDGTSAYANLLDAMKDIGEVNGTINGIAVNGAGLATLYGAVDTTGRPIFTNPVDGGLPRVLGAPVVQSANAGGDITGDMTISTVGVVGDWDKMIVGTYGGIDIAISDQATINTGTSQINLWQRNMFALRAEMQVGVYVASSDYFKHIITE